VTAGGRAQSGRLAREGSGALVLTSGRSLPLVGHLGLGGVVGLAVPGAGVALAVTVSQLSVRCTPTRRLVELLLRECGLRLEPGFFSEA